MEIYTSSEVWTNDLDLVAPDDGPIIDAFKKLGFEKPSGAGVLIKGLVHPDYALGIEIVSNDLMDGRADQSKVFKFELENGAIWVTPVEDLVADRLAQAFSSPRPLKDMLDQAVNIYRLAESVDESYLDRRIKEETGGDFDLRELKGLFHGTDSKS